MMAACALAINVALWPGMAQAQLRARPNEPALPGKPPPLGMPEGTAPGAPSDTERPNSSGTGFVVADGRVLTNNHVINECGRLAIRTSAGQRLPARVVATDRQRDLALLTVAPSVGPPLTFRDRPEVRRGESVVTYGFPLSGLLSSGPSLTTGDLSALSGLRDNPVNFQITAPVNPGNSGGPLLDSQANVIGVVVSKLNAMRTAEMTGGDIPQNVNFAIKGAEALAFLREHGVQPKTSASAGPDKRPPEIGDVAFPSTVYIQCYR